MLTFPARGRAIALLAASLFFPTLPVQAAERCASINCDCASLLDPAYVATCERQQLRVEAACAEDKSADAFCTVHGPAAHPLALVTRVPNVPATDSVRDANEAIASFYWSARQDANFSIDAYKEGNLKNATTILRIAERNLDSLFETQQSVAEYWIGEGKEDKAQDAWEDYASDTESLADHWQKYADSLNRDMSRGEFDRDTALLMKAVADITGRCYEQAGWAAGFAGRDKDAADAWYSAARIASRVVQMLEENGISASTASEYRHVTASRLHRASYHWLVNEDKDDAQELLVRSSEFMSSDILLQDLLAEEQRVAEEAAQAQAELEAAAAELPEPEPSAQTQTALEKLAEKAGSGKGSESDTSKKKDWRESLKP